MHRRHDWPERLGETIERYRSTAFAYGSADCCLFACDAVLAMTGIDPAAQFRGRYRTKTGAYRLLKRFAGGGVEETWRRIAEELRLPEISPRFAQRGDVVLIREGSAGPALAVAIGAKLAGMGPTGVSFIGFDRALHAWRI